MDSFYDIYSRYNWDDISTQILLKTKNDVENALSSTHKSLNDFMALVSPAASGYIEQLAQQSHRLTQQRFGRTMKLFIPLYLSNECKNICTYCGLSITNRIPRHTLTIDQIQKETILLKQQGFDSILLVSGESPTTINTMFLKETIELLRSDFSKIGIEVQPLEQLEYELLIDSGLHNVSVYQETYHQKHYKQYHLAGQKANFHHRLLTPDRLGKAGVNTVGLGVLLGLEEWRTESFFLALHLNYLKKRYWKTKYSLSFPRIKPHEGKFKPNIHVTSKEFTQLICAFRLFDEDVELTLSTREPKDLRDNLIQLGITTMSAGSKTNPGGYDTHPNSLKQFEISDERSSREVCEMLYQKGYEVVWKDWDQNLMITT